MRASSPPGTAADQLELGASPPRAGRGGPRVARGVRGPSTGFVRPVAGLYGPPSGEDEVMPGRGSPTGDSARHATAAATAAARMLLMGYRTLPWSPKVRQRDLEYFFEQTRAKFIGFQVPQDTGSLAGMPHPIHEAVKVLKKHLYTSLADVQIKREEEIARCPLSRVRRLRRDFFIRSLGEFIPELEKGSQACYNFFIKFCRNDKFREHQMNSKLKSSPFALMLS